MQQDFILSLKSQALIDLFNFKLSNIQNLQIFSRISRYKLKKCNFFDTKYLIQFILFRALQIFKFDINYLNKAKSLDPTAE